MGLSSSQKVSARSFVLKLGFNDGVTKVKIDGFVHSLKTFVLRNQAFVY